MMSLIDRCGSVFDRYPVSGNRFVDCRYRYRLTGITNSQLTYLGRDRHRTPDIQHPTSSIPLLHTTYPSINAGISSSEVTSRCDGFCGVTDLLPGCRNQQVRMP